jgi:uncharacterized protein YjiS (DUF1127 family)
MAVFDTSRPHVLFPRFEGAIANIFGSLIAWNDARVIRTELNRLSDRELDDIGLVRGDIDEVARRK